MHLRQGNALGAVLGAARSYAGVAPILYTALESPKARLAICTFRDAFCGRGLLARVGGHRPARCAWLAWRAHVLVTTTLTRTRHIVHPPPMQVMAMPPHETNDSVPQLQPYK